MDKNSALNLIRETFQNPFDKLRFTWFIKNLLNHIEETPSTVYRGNIIPDAYKPYIHTLDRIGKYKDAEGNRIDLLIIHLKKETSLDRARTMQRNFIAWYLDGSRGGDLKDAALVAFVSPDQEDWRFSLVKMEYRLDISGEKIKTKKELTPARRHSFLVGKNENSHTAQSFLISLLENDENDPTLKELEEAFSIEKVTKEFFGKYRELYLKVKENLDEIVKKDSKIKNDFAEKNVNIVDFAKKLLGQIVFLYFLQKKGWFGVEKNADWGSGPKDFLRRLFERKIIDYQNFFNDMLEPLFYEALATERTVDYYSRFNCKIPFLNGGLFDPINNYDWVHTDILMPNELFSNSIKIKEGDMGSGILDVFDRYNFTVKEDEPLEKEVAVDPEMLGKVFENLLEVKDRKSKGTYYTPREIVHYMCRESLINYIDTTVNTGKNSIVPQQATQDKLFGKPDPEQLSLKTEGYILVILRKDIEFFIRQGESTIEHDSRVVKEGRETRDYSFQLPESIRKNARLIDAKLADIKICDPAIGSGAFPVGMLHEIVSARKTLTVHIEKSKDRTAYDFKRHAIHESIYGVDIDSSAVDIAKLRLWLSLVVDEDDFKSIKPLPNLDYKIACGNSLLKVEKDLFNLDLFKELEALKEKFFDETNVRKKEDEKKKIDKLIKQITNNDEHFDFEVYFSEVFHSPSNSPFGKGGQGGFDVVIANPPYVRHEGIKKLKKQLAKEFGEFYCGTADLYTYFYKKGLDLLETGGHLCFIAPNKFMRAGYGKNTRKLLTAKALPKVIIDFGDLPIFDATTYPAILLVENQTPAGNKNTIVATFSQSEQLVKLDNTMAKIAFSTPVTALKQEGWNLEKPEVLALMEKLDRIGTPLLEYINGKFYYGLKTGLNDAFVIDFDTRKKLVSEDPACGEIIKPWLRGRDIRKWKTEWADLFIINIPSSSNQEWPWTNAKTEAEAKRLFEQAYPAILKHLTQWEDKLRKRDDQGKFWWELRSCAYYGEFKKDKITWGNLATNPKFAFDSSASYVSAPANIIPVHDLYLLAILNSPLCKWLISLQAATRSGGFLEFKPMYVDKVPVFPASNTQKSLIIKLIKTILDNPEIPEVQRLEQEVNKLVYKLYDLTPEEIKIVKKAKQ